MNEARTIFSAGEDRDSSAQAPWLSRGLVVVLLVGALVRVALWLWWRSNQVLTGDEGDYHGIAERLVQTGTYISADGEPNSLRPPLYPGFVALVYALFGVGNFAAVRAIQAAVSLLTVVVVHRMGREAYGPRVALIASALFCFYPPLLGFANLILTETWFTFLFAATALGSVLYLRHGRTRDLALAGLWCGLGALTRSALVYWPPFLILLVLALGRESLVRRLVAAGTLALVFVAVITPWTIRNTSVQKTFTMIDCMGGRNLMMGNYEYTPMDRTWATIEIKGETAWDQVLARANPEFLTATQGQRDKLAMRHGVEFMKSHPWLTAQRALRKFFHFWQLERTLLAGALRGRFGPAPRPVILGLAAVAFLAQGLVMVSALYGGFLAPPADRRIHWLLVLMMGLICGMHTLIFGHSRYHLPLVSVLAIYSASALVSLGAIWANRRTWRFVFATILSLALVSSWLIEIFWVDYGRFVESAESAGANRPVKQSVE